MFDNIMSSNSELERKGTFVGTVNYLAPEMIKECEANLATDMWALGCIIFKMYTGKVPFPGMSEAACFPMILSRKIDWPKNLEMDPVIVDLIDCLLQVDPIERLGCPETAHDIRRLMRHRFFKGINFKTNLAESTDIRKALADSEIAII
jgi:3-phosphoinositide dependent protein kinase-1